MRKLDSKGIPFEYDTCFLSKREYAKIIGEINTDYFRVYVNEPYPIHFSLGEDDKYYGYYFENHGFDDYNIVEKYLVI